MTSRWDWRVVKGLMLAVALALFATNAQAQQMEDVVYLKDGSVIRGTIVEQRPGESILIRTRDGNQFRYAMSAIDRMTKEPAPGSARQGPVVGRKSPGLAFLLSFLLTGAGQGYNGQWGKAAGMFGGVVVSYAVLGAGWDPCYDDDECGLLAAGFLGVVGFALWSWIDAPISASAINLRLTQGASLEVGPRVQLGFAPAAGFRYAPTGGQWTMQRKPQLQVSLGRIRF